jgi:hypothetical protein
MRSPQGKAPTELTREAMAAAANDKDVSACRRELARFSSSQLQEAGTELHLLGHIIGRDRGDGSSPSRATRKLGWRQGDGKRATLTSGRWTGQTRR